MFPCVDKEKIDCDGRLREKDACLFGQGAGDLPNHRAVDCFHLEAGASRLRKEVRAREAGQEGGQAQGAIEAQGTDRQTAIERASGHPEGGGTHRQQPPQGRGQQPAQSQRRTTERVTCHRNR